VALPSGGAMVLETMDDITTLQSEGLINVNLARPMNSVHIVNSPFIDPFQSISAINATSINATSINATSINATSINATSINATSINATSINATSTNSTSTNG